MFLKLEKMRQFFASAVKGVAVTELIPNTLPGATCGVLTKQVSLVGTGIHFCNFGGACFCNYVSDSPGACKYGNNLIKAG